MTKRILSSALSLVLLLSLLPGQAQAVGEYTIGVSASTAAVSTRKTVTVTLDLSSSWENTYNAYDIEITYDAEKLTYESCTPADSTADIQPGNGSIRIVGYGSEKEKTVPVAVLTFTAQAEGTATVQITSAKIDRSSNAIGSDADDCVKDDQNPISASITVLTAYTVSLGEGLEADSTEALKDQDYTFRARDYQHYDYTITAKIGNNPVNVTDHKDGTYTISGEKITGNITVTATRTPKTYDVTFTGQNVTGEKTAVYNTPYTFKLSRQTGYDYTVKVTIGGKEYTKYTLENDVYTIPGTDITGKIAVTVTKTRKTSSTGTTGTTSGSKNNTTTASNLSVTFSGPGGEDITGNKTVKKGTAYTFKLKKEEGYQYTISVQIGGKTVDYTYDQEKDTYTIPASAVTGNITISVSKTVIPRITEYITLDGQSIYLIRINGEVAKDQVPKFDGQTMYRSDVYPGYTWLIQSKESADTIYALAEQKITIAEGKAESSVDYSGNVNMSGEIDINDAQLVFDMYSAKYLLADVPVLEFLSADVNGDGYVNILDVEWILNKS